MSSFQSGLRHLKRSCCADLFANVSTRTWFTKWFSTRDMKLMVPLPASARCGGLGRALSSAPSCGFHSVLGWEAR